MVIAFIYYLDMVYNVKHIMRPFLNPGSRLCLMLETSCKVYTAPKSISEPDEPKPKVGKGPHHSVNYFSQLPWEQTSSSPK